MTPTKVAAQKRGHSPETSDTPAKQRPTLENDPLSAELRGNGDSFDENDENDDMEGIHQATTQRQWERAEGELPKSWPARGANNPKPTPIVLDFPKTKFGELMDALQVFAEYKIRAVTKYTILELYCFNLADYEKLNESMDLITDHVCGERLHFHTYAPKTRRQLRVVINPLPVTVTESEISQAILGAGLRQPLFWCNACPGASVSGARTAPCSPSRAPRSPCSAGSLRHTH